MRNPYTKPSAKRTWSDTEDTLSAAAAQAPVAVEASRSEQQQLDQSFGASDMDWNAAVQLLDQASESYERNGNKPEETSMLKSHLSLPSQGTNVTAVRNLASTETEGKRQATGPSQSTIITETKPSSTGGPNPINPYKKAKPTSKTVVKEVQPTSKPSAAGVAKAPPPSSGTVPISSSMAVAPINPLGNSVARAVSVSSPAKATEHPTHAATVPNAGTNVPQHLADPSQLTIDLTGESKLPFVQETSRSMPLPASWKSNESGALTATEDGSRPSSSSGPQSIQHPPTLQHQTCAKGASRLSAAPARIVPLPPSWVPNSATTASMPGKPTGSKPSSSQGQQAGSGSAQNTGLPAALNYSSEQVQPINDEYRPRLVKNANLSAPLLNGWTLFSHQKKAILRALLMRRFILALDMGLGKTLIGCVWAKAFQQTFDEQLKIIVVCPVSLKNEWKRTAQEATGLQVDDDDSQSLSMQICSWAKVPSEVPSDVPKFVVVFDEAHCMQSLQAARTKDALQLVRSQRCVGVLMLTGTPMKNGKPCNLFPLLKAVRHPFGDNQKAFESYFCDGKDKSFGRGRVVWDANGSSNLVQLRQHVASHMLYMSKEECLDELPKKTREFRQVAVSSRHQLQHNSALNELAKVYATSGNLENSGDLILTAVQRVRQIGSFAKIDATVALAKDVLQEQPAVVIFSSFVTVAKTVHKQLSESGWEGELLTGETPAKKRQGIVDNFQAGLSPVFVATFGAGGVGLTLTAAHTIILLDRPWTPGEAQQAEDRVRRIGQTKPVTSIWMVAFDLDKQIDSLLEQKSNNASVVLEEGKENVESAAAPKISVFQLLKSLLGNQERASKIGVATPINSATMR